MDTPNAYGILYHVWPFQTPDMPVFVMLGSDGGDLLISHEANADGTPDWSNASLADPRGCETDTEWEACAAFGRAFKLAAQVRAEAAHGPAQDDAPDLSALSVDDYADRIIRMIRDDISGFRSKNDARRTDGFSAAKSFTDLHDVVDANMYMIDAGVPYDYDDTNAQAFYVTVQERVGALLRAGLHLIDV